MKNNTGTENTGVRNSGYFNSGYCNSGNNNSGYWNSGNNNSGYWNSGSYNSGYHNSGDYNSGDWNSGNCNSGDYNSGDWNSGDWNAGYFNSGHRNSGHYNSGDWNTNSPDKIRIFNTWIDMTHEEFNKKYNIYAELPLNRWVDKDNMTDEEKSSEPGWETTGGYLKTLDYKEACRVWWGENPERHKDFLSLPNFNAEIFKEITGIDVEQPSLTDEELLRELERRNLVHNGKVIV
jgi:hypothetical protein